MDTILVRGGRRLQGEVPVAGAKNAALPILFATLLTDDPCELRNLPDVVDVRTTLRLLEDLGATVERRPGGARITAAGVRRRATGPGPARRTPLYLPRRTRIMATGG